MQNKLQELTDKLYNEGLSRGKKEAEELKASAVAESEKILADARRQAEEIVEKARKEAADLKARSESDIRMASQQTISSIRQQVENLIITRSVSQEVKAGLKDNELIKSLLVTVAKAFNAADPNPAGLEVILPEGLRKALSGWFTGKAQQEMGTGIEVSYSRQFQGGFRIGPRNGGYMISFAEGDFENILSEYLRPATRKLLFG